MSVRGMDVLFFQFFSMFEILKIEGMENNTSLKTKKIKSNINEC